MARLIHTLRRLLPGILLIAAAAVVLLLSDQRSRRGPDHVPEPAAAGAPQRIAILQHSSSLVMDDLREGFVTGLAARGWTEGERLTIDVYNAQGDLPVGNTMATRLAAGDYRLVATISTPMLQAFANANRSGRSTHVFMGVTAPVEAGVGIVRLDSTEKPKWMAGIGSAQPVDAIIPQPRVHLGALEDQRVPSLVSAAAVAVHGPFDLQIQVTQAGGQARRTTTARFLAPVR
jgi:hypothetical protein